MKTWLIIINVFVLFGSTIGKPSELLKVSLYYEALCPYCQRFIVGQLYPGYQKLGSSLIVELVPYGNANREQVDGHWSIECQHGEFECTLNKLQACGLSKNTNQDEQLDFVKCVESVADDDEDIEPAVKCVKKIGVNSTVLLDCVNGKEGDELLIKAGEKTDALDPPHKYVPWVIFNDRFDENNAQLALEDFVKTACSLMAVKPIGCPTDDGLIHLSF